MLWLHMQHRSCSQISSFKSLRAVHSLAQNTSLLSLGLDAEGSAVHLLELAH